MEVKYWLVSAVNALAGELCIVPFGANELKARVSQVELLRVLCPNEHCTICTNECATTFVEQRVKFVNGIFVKL